MEYQENTCLTAKEKSKTYHIQRLSHKTTMNCPFGNLLWCFHLGLDNLDCVLAHLDIGRLLQLASLGDLMLHRNRRGADDLPRSGILVKAEQRPGPERIGKVRLHRLLAGVLGVRVPAGNRILRWQCQDRIRCVPRYSPIAQMQT